MIGLPYVSSFANFRNRTLMYFRCTAFPKKVEKAALRCCRCSSVIDPHHVRFDWPITNFSCNGCVEKYFENNIAISPYKRVAISMIVTTVTSSGERNTNDVLPRGGWCFQPDAHVSVILLTASWRESMDTFRWTRPNYFPSRNCLLW